jgi:beta-N-acetylhexosaminidase
MFTPQFKRRAGRQLLVGFEGTTFGTDLRALLREFAVGGIVLFKRNVDNREQLQVLLEETQAWAREQLGRQLWVAIDHEGGAVQRLPAPYTQLPAALDLAARGGADVAATAATGARELRATGIHVNFAPVLDVVSDPDAHFLARRSLGPDPEAVARLGCAWIRALQDHGLSATAKHFPGLGQADLDPHHHAPIVQWRDDDAMERDLVPFRAAVAEGVDCVMTSHALYPQLDPVWPATLSAAVNRRWLRAELGFTGILVSDDLAMAAVYGRYSWEEIARQGLLAGTDWFLLCQDSAHIEPFYRALWDGICGRVELRDAHRDACARIDALARKHALRRSTAVIDRPSDALPFPPGN